jgi:hypothetical protein
MTPTEQTMISESIVLRCIASCLETSQYHVGKGNRPLAKWWHDRADMYVDRLPTYRRVADVRNKARIEHPEDYPGGYKKDINRLASIVRDC